MTVRKSQDAKARGGAAPKARAAETRAAGNHPADATKANDSPTPGGPGLSDARRGRFGVEWQLVALMLLLKAFVYVYGAHAYQVVSERKHPSFYSWLEIWGRWDAISYLGLARDGYVTTGDERNRLAFYPLYPLATRLAALVTGGDYLVAALLVSCVASIAAGLLLYRLALLDHSEEVSRRAVFFLFVFPTSYFLHAPYTEGLFLALALASFLSARRGRWALAGGLGALASMTRVNGLLLVPALTVEAFQQYRATRRFDPRWLWIAFAGAGFGVYLLLNKRVAGDYFAFLHIQRQNWFRTLDWPWVGLYNLYRSGAWRGAVESHMITWQESFFILLSLICAVWSWKKLRASYAVWVTANWLLVTSSAFVLSTPRYALILFPLYLMFARLSAASFLWGALVTAWSLMYLAFFISRYVHPRWAF